MPACQNADHDEHPPPAVALITLNALRETGGAVEGYAVCPPHLLDYAQFFIDCAPAHRLMFTVEPA